jgi:hypothetical protein
MNRLLGLAALTCAAAAVPIVSGLMGGAPAGAAPHLDDAGSTVCVVTNPDNSQSACLDLTAGGHVSGGRVYGTASMQLSQPYTGERIARFQIDRVSVKVLYQALAVSGPVNSTAARNPISASTSAADPYYSQCSVRYHSVLDYSVRLTDGSLRRGSYISPWFDSAAAHCAGSSYDSVNDASRCVIRRGDGSLGGCVDLSVSGVLSNDSKSVYARGSLAVEEWVQDANRIARVQVDHVDLRKDGAVVAHSGPANSQSQGTPGQAEAQLAGGYTWSAGCTSSYRVVVYYSARLTSGTLVTGSLATQTFKAPTCR